MLRLMSLNACGTGRASLWVVSHCDLLGAIDILVDGRVDFDIDGNISRQVELAVERANMVTTLDRSWCAELPNVCCASIRSIKALLDTVAFILNEWEGEVDVL